jgi:dTDP-4-amino-4,6-dideoxygalactose transaminase
MESHESHFNDRFFDVYQNSGVETLVSWPKPVHHHEARDLNRFHLPKTERISNEVLSLSMYPELSNKHVGYVIESARRFYE